MYIICIKLLLATLYFYPVCKLKHCQEDTFFQLQIFKAKCIVPSGLNLTGLWNTMELRNRRFPSFTATGPRCRKSSEFGPGKYSFDRFRVVLLMKKNLCSERLFKWLRCFTGGIQKLGISDNGSWPGIQQAPAEVDIWPLSFQSIKKNRFIERR